LKHLASKNSDNVFIGLIFGFYGVMFSSKLPCRIICNNTSLGVFMASFFTGKVWKYQ